MSEEPLSYDVYPALEGWSFVLGPDAMTQARSTASIALDELVDALTCEQRYVSESAGRLLHVSAEESLAIMRDFAPLHQRAEEARSGFEDALKALVSARLATGDGGGA